MPIPSLIIYIYIYINESDLSCLANRDVIMGKSITNLMFFPQFAKSLYFVYINIK